MFKDKAEERGNACPEFESTQPWEDRIYGQPWRAKLESAALSAPQSPQAKQQPLISPPAAEKTSPGDKPRPAHEKQRSPLGENDMTVLLYSLACVAGLTLAELLASGKRRSRVYPYGIPTAGCIQNALSLRRFLSSQQGALALP